MAFKVLHKYKSKKLWVWDFVCIFVTESII